MNKLRELRKLRYSNTKGMVKGIEISDRYIMYSDGVIYDTEKAEDIPQWIFEFRDFVLENYQEMKHNIIK